LQQNTLIDLKSATSIIIGGAPKNGKVTFLLYLIKIFFKEKAVVITTQEKYLFQRRIDSLSSQFEQFSDLNSFLTPLYLKKDWHTLKQKYGYKFFITELENIISTFEEKIIVIHRFGEFFEFQDRYEIENVYKSLIKIADTHGKKVIFTINENHENYEFVRTISQEFSDIDISISVDEKTSERFLSIKNILRNQEYPLMNFKIESNRFNLNYYETVQNKIENRVTKVLLVEFDKVHGDIPAICSYILTRKNIELQYATF